MPQQGGGGKQPRTKSAVLAALENELKDARMKEFKAKLKVLFEARSVAKKVLQAKQDEIDALAEEYSDVLAPE
jgi:hypothetical protein